MLGGLLSTKHVVITVHWLLNFCYRMVHVLTLVLGMAQGWWRNAHQLIDCLMSWAIRLCNINCFIHRPIHDAIEIGSLEIVKLLIKYGADPMADLGDKTPLEFSKSLEQTGIHEYILCECAVLVHYMHVNHQDHCCPRPYMQLLSKRDKIACPLKMSLWTL